MNQQTMTWKPMLVDAAIHPTVPDVKVLTFWYWDDEMNRVEVARLLVGHNQYATFAHALSAAGHLMATFKADI